MRTIFALLSSLVLSIVAMAQQKDYPIQPVDFTRVKLDDKFWLPRVETNRTVTIPASFARCESTGRVKNFVMAAAHEGKFCTTYPFDDTDIYKTIEGASYSLAVHPDPKLAAYIDSLIAIVGKAQEPDGYLYTARTIDSLHPQKWAGMKRWEKERELSHELYNAGHLYEAAAAHYLATKKKNFLNIALKNANLVCSVFGPGKMQVAPGHEIVEMGLVKLYRITGQQKYLQTAKFFIEARGHYPKYDVTSTNPWKNGKYWQDDKPVTQQNEAEGHAVRAGYLYSGMADVAALTGDDSLKKAIDNIWQNMVDKKIYVQGGVGALGDGERFGDNYQLPNATAYNETCAAIANVYFNQRMFLLHGDSKYIDVLEKTLYNGLISGVGLDGKSFFYTNAMQVTNTAKDSGSNGFTSTDVEVARSGWFECSCCPTNLVRFLPSLPGYIYAVKGQTLFANLFIAGKAVATVDKNEVEVIQQNNYPWDGDLKFDINPKISATFNLAIRVPGWARNEAIPSSLYSFASQSSEAPMLKINGKKTEYALQNGYAIISKKWQKGDVVELELPMPTREVKANGNVKDDINKLALQRGPIIYCAEWPDNGGKVSNFYIAPNTTFNPTFQPNVLNGIMELKADLPQASLTNDSITKVSPQKFTAIPYYAWANRGKGEMQIWFTQIDNKEAIRVKDISTPQNNVYQ